MRIPSAAKLKLHDFSFDDNELDDDETLKVSSRASRLLDSIFSAFSLNRFANFVAGLFTYVPRFGFYRNVSHRLRRIVSLVVEREKKLQKRDLP